VRGNWDEPFRVKAFSVFNPSHEMQVHLQEKKARDLLPSDIVFQTSFWSALKSRLGWQSRAFDLRYSGPKGDVLVLTKSLLPGISIAYIPQGPEIGPEPDQYGIFLEALSDAMRCHLHSSMTFIRYDLPWESQYKNHGSDASGKKEAFHRPEPRLQELRMNFGTKTWNLRKAPVDLTFADRVVVDLNRREDKILSEMKPKTRYNIRLARKRGVKVFLGSPRQLPTFYDLYRQTSERNRFPLCEYRHFSALFSALSSHTDFCQILFLLATHDADPLAGAIIAISGKTATYLFGASSDKKRNVMGPYSVHWTTMQIARARGCLRYDLGAVSPGKDPEHPYFGMYRFKTGFGGKIIHQSGSWDYPLDDEGYEIFRNSEMIDGLTSRFPK
jgi:lipid II:glycine glycyltransferase (peptidoglycan interpeptide bridge formation enzyme)